MKDRVNEWVALTYNDANNVIKMNTDDKIVVNGIFKIEIPYKSIVIPHDVNYSLITEFKDGRYRLLMNNVRLMGAPIGYEGFPTFEKFKEEYKKSINALSGSDKKLNEKILNNEKKLREVYDDGAGMQILTAKLVKNYLETLQQDLYNFTGKGSANSEW